ncbi:MAG: protein kinase [Stigonema ocellatum SAG 48.90 = DSM 106950]|nr:protein kinase [Stigonema ocellatum SAG 48.90 = DSM 106950]
MSITSPRYMEHQPGDIINGRYRIISFLARGGFGETYLAEDTQSPEPEPERVRLLKYLRPLMNSSEVLRMAQERFRQEAEVMRRLGKDNQQIPQLYDDFQENQRFYLVQEYIKGENLHEELRTRLFSETQVIEVLSDVLKVLDYLYRQNVIHRDIKPANLIRRRCDNRIFLIDFGAVKEVSTTNAQGQTNPTIAIGTPDYMPPEQCNGRPRFASDIHALGITGFVLLTGRIPQKNQLDEIIWNGEQVSPGFKEILDKMVRPKCEERYERAADVLCDLEPLTMLGQTLNQRYNIKTYLGGGGCSHTYLAEDPQRAYQPNCIIKQLKLKVNRQQIWQEAQSRFATEVRTVEGLPHHEQIPRFLNHFQNNQEFYLVYEFIEGEVLSKQIKEGDRLQEEEVINLLKDVLQALTFIHQHGVIHGDIKPSNLIHRKQDGKIILIDFAAFKQIINLEIDHRQKILINPGGSHGYMPPEQLKNKLQLCSDIYALGMTAIQALTGELPDQLPTDAQNQVIWQNKAQVSPKLAKILNKMVRFQATERYQSAQDVLKDLDDLNNWWLRQIVKFKLVFVILGVFSISLLCFIFIRLQEKEQLENLFNEGLVSNNNRNYEDAIKKFDQALEKAPDTPEILVAQGYAYGKIQKFPEQLGVCKQAVRIDPNSLDSAFHPSRSWLCLGNANYGLGLGSGNPEERSQRYKESLQDYDKAIKLACSSQYPEAHEDCGDAWNNKGESLLELQKLEDALDAFENAIQQNKEHYVAWTNKGNLLLKKSPKKAKEAFQKALAIKPDYKEAKEGLKKAQ